jgi:PAS domain S-box-containing protein
MRILIADDHEIMRRGVRSLLAAESNWEICGEAIDGRDAVSKATHLRPDVIVMDVSMPCMNGLEAARAIRQSFPEIEILVLTQHESDEIVRQAFKAGAKGYVSKSAISENLVSAVQVVARHEFFSPDNRPPESSRPTAAGTQQILQREAFLEQALRESEERFRSTFEQVAVGMAHVNLDGYFQRINQRLCDILGFGQTIPQGIHFRDVTHPDDVARSEDEFARLLSGETTHFSIVKRYLRPDGSVIWANTSSNLVRDSQGDPGYVVTVVEDITETVRSQSELNSSIAETVVRLELAQCALREKDEQLQVALAASSTGTFRWDTRTGELLEFDNNARRLFGFAPGEAVTSVAQLMDRMHPDDLPTVSSAMERCRTGADLEFENRVVLSDGTTRWLYARGKTALDSTGRPCVVGALTDITKRKQAETELIEARDDLEHRVEIRTRELVKTMSHLEAQMRVRQQAEEKMRSLSARLLHLQDDERRRIARDLHDTCGQTLSAMKMTSDAIKRTVDLNLTGRHLFDDLDALTEQALEEVRTTSHLLHPPLLDEIGFVSAAHWLVDGLMARSRIEIDLNVKMCERIPAPLELVLFRVLQECLTNIHRHSGSPRASIHCEQADGQVVLKVRDYGSGVPAEVLERFRCTGMAAGVGLAGMQERVRELNGKMEIESSARGTVVTITVPVPEVPADKLESTTAAATQRNSPVA